MDYYSIQFSCRRSGNRHAMNRIDNDVDVNIKVELSAIIELTDQLAQQSALQPVIQGLLRFIPATPLLCPRLCAQAIDQFKSIIDNGKSTDILINNKCLFIQLEIMDMTTEKSEHKATKHALDEIANWMRPPITYPTLGGHIFRK